MVSFVEWVEDLEYVVGDVGWLVPMIGVVFGYELWILNLVVFAVTVKEEEVAAVDVPLYFLSAFVVSEVVCLTAAHMVAVKVSFADLHFVSLL